MRFSAILCKRVVVKGEEEGDRRVGDGEIEKLCKFAEMCYNFTCSPPAMIVRLTTYLPCTKYPPPSPKSHLVSIFFFVLHDPGKQFSYVNFLIAKK